MFRFKLRPVIPFVLLIALLAGPLGAEDPFASQDRNLVSPARNLPVRFGDSNRLWQFKLGGKWALSQPKVVGDCLLVGGDAKSLQDEDLKRGNPRGGGLFCFDRQTGKLRWELSLPGDSYAGSYGSCTPPAVEGDRLYIHANLFIACVDLNGLEDGNDGPFTDELTFYSRYADEEPIGQLKNSYADILWVYDLKAEHGIYMHDASAGTPLIDGELLWCNTSNALGRRARWTPTDAPYVVVLDKKTGKLIARDQVEIPMVFHGTWSTLTAGEVAGRKCVFWADGYGFLRAFAPVEADAGGKVRTLQEIWAWDANPPGYRMHEGKPILYTRHRQLLPKYPAEVENYVYRENHRENTAWGPCEFIATPVYRDGKIYIGIGRDHYYTLEGSEHGGFYCIDPDAKMDPPAPAVEWTAPEVGRTQCTVSIVDGLIFVGDMTGTLSCLDQKTGRMYWQETIDKHITCRSQWVADGKVYLASDRGEMYVWAAAKEKKLLGVTRLGGQLSTPDAVDGVMYIVDGKTVSAYSVENQPAEVKE